MSQNPQNNPEKDPAWDLLNAASTQQPSPLFSRNVMRAIRLEGQNTAPWWKRILAPRPIVATLATAAACVAITLTVINHGNQPVTTVADNTDATPVTTEVAIDQIASEYDVPEDLDDIIDPLMLISLAYDSTDYSLHKLGL